MRPVSTRAFLLKINGAPTIDLSLCPHEIQKGALQNVSLIVAGLISKKWKMIYSGNAPKFK
jgi:hypothetical protein